MNRAFLVVTTVTVGALIAFASSPAVADAVSGDAPPGTVRLALLTAANDGGPDRPRLRYAGTDAQAFADVLTELGGVRATDATVLVDANRAQLEEALATLHARAEQLSARGTRVEVVLYYSGHSDENGLLLGRELLPYDALRARIDEMPAALRVVVLDSCSSGALLRKKGGRHLPPFLVDESGRVDGHAILTSSRDDEASQESDRVRGSFFTHALVSGLRGAADTSTDGRVTLSEAYQFAFAETLARTELAQGGAQHPAWDIQLAGTGDWVVTDLRSVDAGLELAPPVAGRVFVRDERGHLVVELQKSAGSAVVLGLAPGKYSVRVQDKVGVREGAVVVAEGTRATLGALVSAERVATVSRGTVASVGDVVAKEVEDVFVNVALLWPIESNAAVASGRARNRIGLHFVLGTQEELAGGIDLAIGGTYTANEATGAMLAVGGNVVGGDVVGGQASVGANIVGGDVSGAQATVGANIVGGDVTGAMVSVGTNIAAGRVNGGQATVGLNWATDGFSVAQVSSGANVAGGESTGLALGLGNVHSSLTGLQLGIVNVAGDVTGAQVGIINVAAESTASLGIISIVGDGVHQLGAMTTDIAPVGIVGRLGSRVLYTSLSAGFNPFTGTLDEPFNNEDAAQGPYAHVALGLGAHIALDDTLGISGTALEIEALGGTLRRTDEWISPGLDILSSLRVLASWRPLPLVHVFGGPALHVLVVDTARKNEAPLVVPVTLGEGGGVSTLLSPGFALGITL